jgi:hypothetical protein
MSRVKTKLRDARRGTFYFSSMCYLRDELRVYLHRGSSHMTSAAGGLSDGLSL